MAISNNWTDVAMDSLEVVDFINENRKGRDAKVRHDQLIAKARKLFHENRLLKSQYAYIANNARRTAPKYLFTLEQTNIMLHSYLSATKMHNKEMEYAALKAIETVLDVNLERQYSVATNIGTFRIDRYNKETNTAYEIDEPYHSNNVEADLVREQAVKDVLGCEFVRIKL